MFTYGEVPYSEMDGAAAAQWVMEGNRMKLPPNCPEQLVALVTRCWDIDPTQRPTFALLQSELEK
jgi:hypothetical protein